MSWLVLQSCFLHRGRLHAGRVQSFVEERGVELKKSDPKRSEMRQKLQNMLESSQEPATIPPCAHRLWLRYHQGLAQQRADAAGIFKCCAAIGKRRGCAISVNDEPIRAARLWERTADYIVLTRPFCFVS